MGESHSNDLSPKTLIDAPVKGNFCIGSTEFVLSNIKHAERELFRKACFVDIIHTFSE